MCQLKTSALSDENSLTNSCSHLLSAMLLCACVCVGWNIIRKKLFSYLVSLTLFVSALMVKAPYSHAFTAIGHEQILRAAFLHMQKSAVLSKSLNSWESALSPQELSLFERGLSRSIIDLDYLPDLWGDVVTYGPVAAAKQDSTIIMFTSLFHYINVTKPGEFWEYDGFAYRNFWGLGNDQLLALPLSSIRAEISPPLGGKDTADSKALHPRLGAYQYEFKGSNKDWYDLYYSPGSAKLAVFPPAYVPATLAWHQYLMSKRAADSTVNHWIRKFQVVEAFLKGSEITRMYARYQIRSLPEKIDHLGIVLHMVQDMGVPQHTQGTIDFCHRELEEMVDHLLCKQNPKHHEYRTFLYGTYSEPLPCLSLYDPKFVDKMLNTAPPLNLNVKQRIGERLRGIAKITNHWRWGDPINSLDSIGTQLPDGKVFTGNSCAEVLAHPIVREQIRLQFNFAVASTIAILQHAINEYEAQH